MYRVGYCINGFIHVDDIYFKAQLRYGAPKSDQAGFEYLLCIHDGKKDWTNNRERVTSGHDWFGDDKHPVTSYKIDDINGRVIISMLGYLHRKDDWTCDRQAVILQQKSMHRFVHKHIAIQVGLSPPKTPVHGLDKQRKVMIKPLLPRGKVIIGLMLINDIYFKVEFVFETSNTWGGYHSGLIIHEGRKDWNNDYGKAIKGDEYFDYKPGVEKFVFDDFMGQVILFMPIRLKKKVPDSGKQLLPSLIIIQQYVTVDDYVENIPK